jgi:hypothetical protein
MQPFPCPKRKNHSLGPQATRKFYYLWSTSPCPIWLWAYKARRAAGLEKADLIRWQRLHLRRHADLIHSWNLALNLPLGRCYLFSDKTSSRYEVSTRRNSATANGLVFASDSRYRFIVPLIIWTATLAANNERSGERDGFLL